LTEPTSNLLAEQQTNRIQMLAHEFNQVAQKYKRFQKPAMNNVYNEDDSFGI
jgi:hypothetical protein